MPTPKVYQSAIIEDGAATFLARVQDNDGTNIVQADFGDITYAVYEMDGTLVNSGTLTVSDVIFDTLQTSDDRWTKDTTGFNFAATLAGTNFPNPITYRVQVTFSPSSGEDFYGLYEVDAIPLLGG